VLQLLAIRGMFTLVKKARFFANPDYRNFRGIGNIITRALPVDLLWLKDMKKKEFEFVCSELGKEYMGQTNEKPTFPVKGLIHNILNGRRCVCMTVERNNKKISVPFVIDSGSPCNLIGLDALDALGIKTEDIFDSVELTLQGIPTVPFSHAHDDPRLKDINLLGWHFLLQTKVFEVVDVDKMEVILYRNEAAYLSSKIEQKNRTV